MDSIRQAKPLAIVELFGGIGAFRKALLNKAIAHQVVSYVEIDKNCVKSYNRLYNEYFFPQSVIDYHLPNDRPVDILMHGSPCQDFSRAGIRQGGLEGSGTRSSLLFETLRVIEEAPFKPQWVIWENVKGVLDRKLRPAFEAYLEVMSELGYTTTYSILNSRDFGIPQRRERLFAVSYLSTTNPFDFGNLKRKRSPPLAEFLEHKTKEKYVVKQPSLLRLFDPTSTYKPGFKKRLRVLKDYCFTICTRPMSIPNAGFLRLSDGRHRVLTERECFRLMGFSDGDFDKLLEAFPEKETKMSSILYKQAGNSIVVPVLEAILQEILLDYN